MPHGTGPWLLGHRRADYWRWEPRRRTSTNPKASNIDSISRGFRTGVDPTLCNPERLRTHELGLETRFSVFEQHGDHLFEITTHIVHRFAL